MDNPPCLITLRRIVLLSVTLSCLSYQSVFAHHVLGRPAYSLNEDSNTPPSMSVETQVGDFFVTYMVFPAFPKATQPGRINLYIQGIDEGRYFNDNVTFLVIDDAFFSNRQEIIGTQNIDDGVYRQGFVFKENGEYLIRAHFEDNEVPYDIDFPLQIGEHSPVKPLVVTVLVLLFTIVGSNLLIGKRAQLAKFRAYRKSET